MVLLGVVERRGRYNRTICSAHGECLASRSRRKQRFFFAASNYLIVLSDHHDARNFRSGYFCADRQTDTTDHFTPCARAQDNHNKSWRDLTKIICTNDRLIA